MFIVVWKIERKTFLFYVVLCVFQIYLEITAKTTWKKNIYSTYLPRVAWDNNSSIENVNSCFIRGATYCDTYHMQIVSQNVYKFDGVCVRLLTWQITIYDIYWAIWTYFCFNTFAASTSICLLSFTWIYFFSQRE